MGLEYYSGPLGRYWVGDWSSFAPQDTQMDLVAAPAGQENLDDEERDALEEVIAWRNDLNRGHPWELNGKVDWQESVSGRYAADKPGFDPIGALHLWAARDFAGLRDIPEYLPHDVYDEPEMDGVFGKGSPYAVLGCDLWLPKRDVKPFPGTWIDDRDITIGSTYDLLDALDRLNQRTWQADETMLDVWRRGDARVAPYPVDVEGLSEEERAEVIDQVFLGFEANARFAFSVMHGLAEFAVKAGMPVTSDF